MPLGPLAPDHEGTLYGTTSIDGDYRGGTFYQLIVQGNSITYKVDYQFGSGTDTAYPVGSIILRGSGFFGIGRLGGGGGSCQGGCGTVFEISP